MYVNVVTMLLKPEYREAFLSAILDDAKSSLQNEPGCVRFDIAQDEQNPNRFFLHEIYKDKAAFEAHVKTPHLLKFRNTIKDDWFDGPRVSTRCGSVFPTDKDWR